MIASITSIQNKADNATAEVEISAIASALDRYYNDYHEYPPTTDGFSRNSAFNITESHLAKILDINGQYYVNWEEREIDGNDPWEEPYRLLIPDPSIASYSSATIRNRESFDIWSAGEDETDFTDDDLNNWSDN